MRLVLLTLLVSLVLVYQPAWFFRARAQLLDSFVRGEPPAHVHAHTQHQEITSPQEHAQIFFIWPFTMTLRFT